MQPASPCGRSAGGRLTTNQPSTVIMVSLFGGVNHPTRRPVSWMTGKVCACRVLTVLTPSPGARLPDNGRCTPPRSPETPVVAAGGQDGKAQDHLHREREKGADLRSALQQVQHRD